jgi:hypothetical protein
LSCLLFSLFFCFPRIAVGNSLLKNFGHCKTQSLQVISCLSTLDLY